MTTTPPRTFDACHQHLVKSGLDLLHWFSVSSLNESLPGRFSLPTLGTPHPLGLMVANTQAFWPPFLADLRRRIQAPTDWSDESVLEEAMRVSEAPLDQFVTRTIQTAVALSHRDHWVGLGHIPDPDFIPLQRYADALGFAPLGRGRLSLHPVHGPWIALRAVMVFAESDDALFTPERDTFPRQSLHSPSCDGCQAPCLAPASGTSSLPPPLSSLPEARKEWLLRRLACPVGASSRYSNDQLFFHYRERQLPGSAD